MKKQTFVSDNFGPSNRSNICEESRKNKKKKKKRETRRERKERNKPFIMKMKMKKKKRKNIKERTNAITIIEERDKKREKGRKVNPFQ